MTELAVVLISRNQAWNIARLIESVLCETERVATVSGMAPAEIVLVDSASTDGTAEIAARYPIAVLRLLPDQRLTAAAGRCVGCQHTTGRLVLFLDGDMELCAGWLARALAVLAERPDVAAISGRVVDCLPSGGRPDPLPEGVDGPPVEVRHGGGAAMYRRTALDEAGCFNPYLYSDEEPALCLRIRHAGHRILRLPYPVAYHYSAPADAPATLLGRRRRNLWLGFGQNLRYFAGTPLLLPYMRERGWGLAPGVMLGVGLVALAVAALTGRWKLLAVWAAGLGALTAGLAVRKRSLNAAVFALLQRLLVLEGTLRGLALTPDDPVSYPARVEVIRQAV